MVPVLVALALLAAQGAAATPPAANEPSDDPATDLAAMQQVYDQSCAAREYGAYDDMCDQLNTQIKAAQAAAERKAREAARRPRAAPRPPASPPAPVAVPPAGPSPPG